jgi:hypothetical protein
MTDERDEALVPSPLTLSPAGDAIQAAPQSARRRTWTSLFALLLLLGAAGWAWNHLRLTAPVLAVVERNMRDEQFRLVAHYEHYVNPSHLVLDMRDVESISPIGAFRALFDAADTLIATGLEFERVTLAHNGEPRFILAGEDFKELGGARAAGQNPVYMIRTLPEKLRGPDGVTHPYGTWEGGIFGVLAKQMADATDAGKTWVRGETP